MVIGGDKASGRYKPWHFPAPNLRLMSSPSNFEQVPASTLNRHFDDIVVMLKAAAKICSKEPAVLKLQQPCHIFGDIHGNFSDLKYFESLLWPLGVSFTAGSFLWLGDYVDRGRYSCVLHPKYVTIVIFLTQALLLWKRSCSSPSPNPPELHSSSQTRNTAHHRQARAFFV